jgi:hypothetical protein
MIPGECALTELQTIPTRELLHGAVVAKNGRRAYTGAMRTAWKKIRYRLEWLALESATKFVPLLSRKACYRLALLLGSLGAMLDRRAHGRATHQRPL